MRTHLLTILALISLLFFVVPGIFAMMPPPLPPGKKAAVKSPGGSSTVQINFQPNYQVLLPTRYMSDRLYDQEVLGLDLIIAQCQLLTRTKIEWLSCEWSEFYPHVFGDQLLKKLSQEEWLAAKQKWEKRLCGSIQGTVHFFSINPVTKNKEYIGNALDYFFGRQEHSMQKSLPLIVGANYEQDNRQRALNQMKLANRYRKEKNTKQALRWYQCAARTAPEDSITRNRAMLCIAQLQNNPKKRLLAQFLLETAPKKPKIKPEVTPETAAEDCAMPDAERDVPALPLNNSNGSAPLASSASMPDLRASAALSDISERCNRSYSDLDEYLMFDNGDHRG